MSKYDDFDEDDVRDDEEDLNDGSGHEEYLAERQRALDDFAERLAAEPSSLYYSEEDWVMLAAYASDVDNFYLLSEAVTRGLIAYPDSPDLNDRRLLMLVDTCTPAELRQVFKAAVANPNASKIARMYKALYDWEDAADLREDPAAFYRRIKEIAIDEDHLTDQEIIEAIHILKAADCLEVLSTDIDVWVKHSFYVDTLWYEMAGNAIEAARYDIASAATRVLTEIAPYNDMYWMLHARALLMRSTLEAHGSKEMLKYADEARDAFETALAINPANPDAKLFDANLLSLTVTVAGDKKDLLLAGESTEQLVNEMTPQLFGALAANFTDKSREIFLEWVKRKCSELSQYDPKPYDIIYEIVNYCGILYATSCYEAVDYILAVADDILEDSEYRHLLEPLNILRLLDKNEPEKALKVFKSLDSVVTDPPTEHFTLRYLVYNLLGDKRKASEAYLNIQHQGMIFYLDDPYRAETYLSPALLHHLLTHGFNAPNT